MKHLSKAAVLALGVLLATAPVAAASGTDRQAAAPAVPRRVPGRVPGRQ